MVGWTKWRPGTLVVGLCLLVSGANSCLAEASQLQFVVHVYNYAGVPDRLIDEAEREASRLFSRSDIRPLWVSCPLSPECGATRGLTVNLIPSPSEKAEGRHPFGYALGTTAWVAPGNLRQVVDAQLAPFPVVLGHVMAHELGHLLLGENSHAEGGVMQARYGIREWQRAARGQMYFSSGEGEKLRDSVRRPRV
jgi:hypothetical protein